MAEAVDRRRRVVRALDLRVFGARLVELPVLDLVDRDAADAHRAALAEDRDRALEVLAVREHRDVDRRQAAGAQAQAHHAGVLGLDVARQRGGIGMHIVDRADQPVDHVDVVAGLVHEGAAVHVPAAAPWRIVVVALRARPEDVDVDHEDAAEALLLERTLHELHRRVQPVLLDHEELDAGVAARAHHRHALVPLGGHRFLAEHMAPGLRDLDRLAGVQAAGRGEHDDVRLAAGEQRIERREAGRTRLRHGGRQRLGPVVAHGDDFGTLGMLGKRREVVGTDAAAADEGEADLAVADGQFRHQLLPYVSSKRTMSSSPR